MEGVVILDESSVDSYGNIFLGGLELFGVFYINFYCCGVDGSDD